MKKETNNKIALLIIVVSFVLLQSNSIQFWNEIVGDKVGAIWSVSIELLAMWFWYNGHNWLAKLTSFVVISTALIHLTASSYKDLDKLDITNPIKKELIQTQQVLENIKDKPYPITIQKTMKHLSELREQLKTSTGEREERVYFKILLQALTITLIFIGQIKAVLYIARNSEQKQANIEQKHEEKPQSNEVEKAVGYSETAKKAQKLILELHTYMRDAGNISKARMMQLLDEPRNTFNKLSNTATDKAGGVSLDKIRVMTDRLNQLPKSNNQGFLNQQKKES